MCNATGGYAMPASKHQLAASAYHLKPSDVRKLLLAAANFRDRCLIKTLWWLGVRRRELTQLDIRDLDAERKRVTIREGKGRKTRVIPIIDDEYLSDLLILIGSRKTGPLFLSNRNGLMAPRSVNHIVATLGAKAGMDVLPGIHAGEDVHSIFPPQIIQVLLKARGRSVS